MTESGDSAVQRHGQTSAVAGNSFLSKHKESCGTASRVEQLLFTLVQPHMLYAVWQRIVFSNVLLTHYLNPLFLFPFVVIIFSDFIRKCRGYYRTLSIVSVPQEIGKKKGIGI